MTDPIVFAAMPPSMADAAGKLVSDLQKGFVRVGELRFLISLPLSVTLSVSGSGVKIVPGGDVEVDRPGMNVFLESVEIQTNGEMFAWVRRFGISMRRKV